MKDLNPAEPTFHKTLLTLAIAGFIGVGVTQAQEGNNNDQFQYKPKGFTPADIPKDNPEFYQWWRQALNQLGIKEELPSIKNISKAYHQFSLQNHPDKHPGEDKKYYEALMHQAGGARDYLEKSHADEEKRQKIQELDRIMRQNPQGGSYWEGAYYALRDLLHTAGEREGEREGEDTQAAIGMTDARGTATQTAQPKSQHQWCPRRVYGSLYSNMSLPEDQVIQDDKQREDENPQASASTTDAKGTPTQTAQPKSQHRSYARRVYDSLYSKMSLPEDQAIQDDKQTVAKAEAEEARRQEKERQRQAQEAFYRQLEAVVSAINETSMVSTQIKTLYAAGLVQSISNQATAALSHHGMVMNSFHNTHRLAHVQLEDLGTGEMLASAGGQTLNKERIQDGGRYSYGQLYGLRMNQGTVDNLTGFNANGYGLEVGTFKQLNGEWSVGLMVGMQKTNSRFKDSQGNLKASNLRLGPFVSWNQDSWHVNTALTYGITDMDSQRRDLVFGQKYQASPRAREWTAYASLGYDIKMDHVASGLVLTPNIEVLYINNTMGELKESGQDDKGLKIDGQKRTHWITRAGLQTSYLIPDSEQPREFRFAVGYQKNQLDDSPIQVGYIDQGNMQPLKTGRYGKGAVYYNGGYSMILKDHQNLHMDYLGATGKNSQSHALALTYEMKF